MKMLLLVLFMCFCASESYGQATSLANNKTIGGTANLRLNYHKLDNQLDESRSIYGLNLRPYILKNTDKAGQQRVTQLFLSYQLQQERSESRNTKFLTSVLDLNIAATFGIRRQIFAKGGFFTGIEYGFGPSISLRGFNSKVAGDRTSDANRYSVGGVGYADVVLGYAFTDRLRVVADVLNFGANVDVGVNDDLALSELNLDAGFRQGFFIGVEWVLKG